MYNTVSSASNLIQVHSNGSGSCLYVLMLTYCMSDLAVYTLITFSHNPSLNKRAHASSSPPRNAMAN